MRMQHLILLLVAATAIAGAPFTKKPAERVAFPAGRSSAKVKGELRGRQEATYLIAAKAGQRLTDRLELQADSWASLQVEDPQGHPLASADGTDAGEVFTGTLKATGDHRVVVFPPETTDKGDVARYTLEIRIE